jgi:hypothetical protein
LALALGDELRHRATSGRESVETHAETEADPAWAMPPPMRISHRTDAQEMAADRLAA